MNNLRAGFRTFHGTLSPRFVGFAYRLIKLPDESFFLRVGSAESENHGPGKIHRRKQHLSGCQRLQAIVFGFIAAYDHFESGRILKWRPIRNASRSSDGTSSESLRRSLTLLENSCP